MYKYIHIISCRFINNLQPTNSNVKLLECYGTVLWYLLWYLQFPDGTETLAQPPLMLKHKTGAYFPIPHKYSIIVYLERLFR